MRLVAAKEDQHDTGNEPGKDDQRDVDGPCLLVKCTRSGRIQLAYGASFRGHVRAEG